MSRAAPVERVSDALMGRFEHRRSSFAEATRIARAVAEEKAQERLLKIR